MGKKLLLLVLLAGCQSPSEGEQDPQRRSSTDPSVDCATPWSRDPETGLAARLKTKGPHSLGDAILVDLELKNFGDRAVYFDSQGLAFIPFGVTGPDRRRIDCVARSAHRGQTAQRYEVLEPGAARDLDRIDLAQAFAVVKAGRYTVRFDGLWKWGHDPGSLPEGVPSGALETPVPESEPLTVEIREGRLTARDRVLRQLIPTVPEDWILYDEGDGSGTTLVYYRPKLDRYGRSATIRVGCKSYPDDGSRTLGGSPFGLVWLGKVEVRRMASRDAEDERWEQELTAAFLPKLADVLKRSLSIGGTK